MRVLKKEIVKTLPHEKLIYSVSICLINFHSLPLPHRATLRRGFAFSSSISNKAPPLIKSRNVTSLSWAHQQSTAAVAPGSAGGAHSIHVVYEPIQTDKDLVTRPETNSSDT